MTWPTVSIVMPVWNAERWIARAVRSCISQAYPGRLEIVVADDGSEDGTGKAIDGARDGANVPVFLLEGAHQGYAAAFNLALAAASGDIIARQDADDWSAPDRILKSVEALADGTADIVSSEMALVDKHGCSVGETHVGGMVEEEYVKGAKAHGPCSTTLVAWRRVYEKVGPFSTDPRWEWSPDSEWNFRALRAGLRWAHIPEPLYFYRIHADRMTTRGGGKGHQAYLEQIEEHLKAKGRAE